VRKNLEFIEHAAETNPQAVHRIVQLTISLLGLIVFPKEKLLIEKLSDLTLAELERDSWPEWNITKDDSTPRTLTLGRLLDHLRNAVAHGRLTYTSDSRLPEDVAIIVEDASGKKAPVNWAAHIRVAALRCFCMRLAKLIDNSVVG
jgi:hypothetical protein